MRTSLYTAYNIFTGKVFHCGVIYEVVFRAEKRSAQASAHTLSQAQGGNFLFVDCVCLLLEF